ncbi:MAG: hypothetical protein V7607_3875 [Solirubrobacteraceae bacterium]
MNPTVVFGQAVVVGLLLAALRAFGNACESIIFGAGLLVLALLIRLCSSAARRGLPRHARQHGKRLIAESAAAIGITQFVLDLFGSINHAGPLRVGVVGVGFIHLGDDHDVAVAMTVVSIAVAGVIYLSSLIDWFYVRSQLLGGAGMVCLTSTKDPWRLVTRVRLAHRLVAVLGFIAGLTALVALAANSWIRPIDETVAGAIGGVAAVVAGYYLARAAPLVALATNPSILICDVVSLAEEFNLPEGTTSGRYFVLDIGWEGVKLREVGASQGSTNFAGECAPRHASAADAEPPPHDRMIDIADVSKLLRRRGALPTCNGPCRRWTGGCLAPDPEDAAPTQSHGAPANG